MIPDALTRQLSASLERSVSFNYYQNQISRQNSTNINRQKSNSTTGVVSSSKSKEGNTLEAVGEYDEQDQVDAEAYDPLVFLHNEWEKVKTDYLENSLELQVDDKNENENDKVEQLDEQEAKFVMKESDFRLKGGVQGGMCVYLQGPPQLDTHALLLKARCVGVSFKPGDLFSCSGKYRNCLRIAVAHYGPAELAKAMWLLAQILLDEE